jgi:hypothetical protein
MLSLSRRKVESPSGTLSKPLGTGLETDITLRYGGGWATIGWIKMGLWSFATTEKNVLPEW